MRILLVRLDGVGDAAVCTPLIAALRAAGHDVGVVLSARNAGIFAPHAIVAEHVLERIPWPAHGSTPESSAIAAAAIAQGGYDAALIASEEPEAYALAAPIPIRVGFTTGWTRPLKTIWVRSQLTRAVSRSQHRGGDEAHEVEVMYRLGRDFVDAGSPPSGMRALRDVLLDSPDVGRTERAVLQAGAKWRAAGVEDALLRRLLARLGADAVRVIAAPEEAAGVESALGVVPETFARLRDWIGALAVARAVITVDTGAAHVAGMLGSPVIDVFPDADFDAQVRRWRPWSSPYRAYRASAVNGGGPDELAEAVLDGF